MNAQRLPANWTDSANALEGIASVAKDTLLLVDEFTPSDAMSTQQLHGKAERLFRAQANHTGRKRMRADTTLRPAKPPEGLVLATGEDIPSGQSLRSRIILIEHRPRSVNLEKLSACQNDAAAGLYAQAMAGFVEWLAPQIGDIKGRWQQELAALRQKVSQSDMHSRTPENIASLALGWRYFLGFAIESKAMAPSEAMVCWMDVWEILKTVAATQGQHLAAAEPASRFLDLLRDALMSQKAYLRNIMPEGSTIEPTPQPGTCVGWDHPQEDRVYLIPDVSYAEAHELGRQSGSPLVVSAQTLRKRLHEQNHIAEVEPGQGTILVRKTLDGKRTRVLVLHRSSLYPEKSVLSVQSVHQGDESPVTGQVFDDDWTGFFDDWTGFKPQPVLDNPLNNKEISVSGRIGQKNPIGERRDAKNMHAHTPSPGQVLSNDSKNLSNPKKNLSRVTMTACMRCSDGALGVNRDVEGSGLSTASRRRPTPGAGSGAKSYRRLTGRDTPAQRSLADAA